ncbi:MAG: glycosyl hydrolase family 18 protein [Patescibacteria group bacterium]
MRVTKFALFVSVFFSLFLFAGSIYASSTPPLNSQIGNILLNNEYKNKTYNFTPATKKPNPMPSKFGSRSLSAYGPSGQEKEVMGFAPYWDLSSNAYQSYQYNNLTTIAYFGITSNSSGNFGTNAPNDPGYQGLNSTQFVDMVNLAHQNNVRVVLTIKIFNLSDIQSVVNTPSVAQNLIANTIQEVKSFNLQGVNIDFEYNPTTDGNPNQTTINNFTTFVSNMTSQMHSQIPGSFISVDTFASAAHWTGSLYNIPALAGAADALNVMAYDFYTSSSAQAYPNAPLTGYNNGNGPFWYDVKQAMKDYASVAPANKIIFGVPYYGNDTATTSFNLYANAIAGTGIEEPYGQTNDKYKNASTKHWDSISSTPWYGYCYPSNNTPPNCASTDQMREGFYENPESLSLTYQQVLDNNLRGVSLWTLGYQEPSLALWNPLNQFFISNTVFSSTASAYYLLSGHGRVLTFGNANYYGDMSYVNGAPNNNAVNIATTASDLGYYILTQDGGIYTFGNAKFYGSVFNIPNAPVKTPVSIVTTPSGNGYYVLTADGGVYTFGDAVFQGSLYNIPASAVPDRTPVAFALTPNGGGYYIVTSNGAVYTFGNAQFHGSVFNIPNAPVKTTVTFALTPSGNGYYLITADGGVYTFGDAVFEGSMFNIPNVPSKTPKAFGVTPQNQGYYILTADGGVYTFGNATYDGTGIGNFSSTSNINVVQ